MFVCIAPQLWTGTFCLVLMICLLSKHLDFSFCRYHLTLVCYLFGYGSSLLHIDLHTFHVLSEICKWVEKLFVSCQWSSKFLGRYHLEKICFTDKILFHNLYDEYLLFLKECESIVLSMFWIQVSSFCGHPRYFLYGDYGLLHTVHYHLSFTPSPDVFWEFLTLNGCV